MQDPQETLQELEIRISFFERHIQEQDREIMRLAKQVDQLLARIEHADKQIREMNASSGENRLNLHEKPPHY